MRFNVLIGGKAGQGINVLANNLARIIVQTGYYAFNARDYQSLITGGHNFNVICLSDKEVNSYDEKLDLIVALDKETLEIHKNRLKNDGKIISEISDSGIKINASSLLQKNELNKKVLNTIFLGALTKALGLELEIAQEVVRKEFKSFREENIKALSLGYNSIGKVFSFKKIKRTETKHKIRIITGSEGIGIGAIMSGIDIYLAYPMTPATPVLHYLTSKQEEYNVFVFMPENEIAVVNSALGASYTGARVMVGTSGGGFDLMSEGLSFQGMSEIPLVVYLASRPGPGTGIPTYTSQGDLNTALRAGHGEFPRIVIAPGDAREAIEKTNEAFYLSQKFNCLSIILADKHLAESQFSFDRKVSEIIQVKVRRSVPGKAIVKANSYEHTEDGATTELSGIAIRNAEKRVKKYEKIKKEVKKLKMIKIFGNKNSKNLVIGWGSTKGAILDAIKDLDFKFLQVLYMKPLSDEIKSEIEKANKVILVENNVTGQLGRLIREKTGMKIENRILRYDGRPFKSDELREKLGEKILRS